MGCCCTKASAKEDPCPEVVVPKVTFNVIENPVTSESMKPVKADVRSRPATPVPIETVADEADEDESKVKGDDTDSEPTWEEVA